MTDSPTFLTPPTRSRGGLGCPRLWLFDLDDTLYNASWRMLPAIHARMEDYISAELHMPLEAAAELQRGYWEKYGATFLGLERFHGIDPHDFFEKTHDFDVRSAIRTRLLGSVTARSLSELPGIKAVITNGPGEYARRVLAELGMSHVFRFVITSSDMHTLGRWRCKPSPSLLAIACARAGVRPESAVLVEDSLDNLKAAKSIGMKTLWCVGYRYPKIRRLREPPYVDMIIKSVDELPRLVTRAPVAGEGTTIRERLTARRLRQATA